MKGDVTVKASKSQQQLGYFKDNSPDIMRRSLAYLHYRVGDIEESLIKLEDMLLVIDEAIDNIMKRLNKIENRLGEQVISNGLIQTKTPVSSLPTPEFTGTNAY